MTTTTMSKPILSLSLSLSLFTLLPGAVARAGETAPAPAPEVARTSDAFQGRFQVDGTLAVGSAAPAKVRFAITCRRTALGRAAACSMAAKTPLGPMEGSMLVGYNELDKAVHFMSMTSDGEVHDHVCRWKGSTLACDPLKGNLGAMSVTEDLSFQFDGKKMTFESRSTLQDGTRIVFTGTGRK
jgi:hypothetical protein